MDEEMVCRLMAQARKKWPADYIAGAKLTVVGKEPKRREWVGLRPLERRKQIRQAELVRRSRR